MVIQKLIRSLKKAKERQTSHTDTAMGDAYCSVKKSAIQMASIGPQSKVPLKVNGHFSKALLDHDYI